jgi:hypothetical protein
LISLVAVLIASHKSGATSGSLPASVNEYGTIPFAPY